jgi:hyperosmotically inducible protein
MALLALVLNPATPETIANPRPGSMAWLLHTRRCQRHQENKEGSMMTRLTLLALAVSAASGAACAGSENRPAQDPASANTTEAAIDISAAPSVSGVNVGAGASTPGATPGTTGTTRSPTASVSVTQSNAMPPFHGSASNATNAAAGLAGTSGGSVLSSSGGTSPMPAADNTKTNDRDRQGALTPMNQGNSEAELKITASIRKGMMSDKVLSFAAKNTKVITVGTKVTLRGPVKTDQEKIEIEALARQTAGVSDVENQLEVSK